jgi:ketosteroid isomerase-like protein
LSNQVKARPAEVVKALLDAVAAGDADSAKALLNPGLRAVEPESLPFGGTYEGVDNFLNGLLPKIFGTYELVVEKPRFFEGEREAAVHMVIAFRSKRTDEEIRMPYVEVYGVVDGEITSVEIYPQDTAVLVDWMAENG